ncbi:P-loop containing nucleoside triphosphate hydrolase protein [Hesseltinella vesiculosa]|uniref:uridine/cytidine kinase n=1 Tax=Hesseltinella vesiculosa TaxID=101127 RepID=A0A1X2GR15_9FUNG|nr:P-loop containing nucleoside triphosphate hydrolase protein [Hesseltinella vesiculosa]
MSIDASAFKDPSLFMLSLKTPMIVGIAGGAQAGKFLMCKHLKDRLANYPKTRVVILSMTDFYRDLTKEEHDLFESGELNLDHPNMFDFDSMETTLKNLLKNEPVTVPQWDHRSHSLACKQTMQPADVILVEGTLALYPKSLRDLMFMKVFIDVDSDQRLTRRTQHLVTGEGRVVSLNQMLSEYVNFVKPMFDEFVLPTKKYADIVIPRGVENLVALQVLENHLEDHLKKRAKLSIDTQSVGCHANPPSATTPSIRSDVLAQSAQSPFKNIPQ